VTGFDGGEDAERVGFHYLFFGIKGRLLGVFPNEVITKIEYDIEDSLNNWRQKV